MSRYPHFYIEVFNHKLGNWEKVDIFRLNDKMEYVPISVWSWNGTHDLFSILGFEESYDMPEFEAMHAGFPVNASPEMYSIFDSYCRSKDKGDDYDYVPTVQWFNLADAYLYLKEHPEVKDVEEMEVYWTEHEVDYEDVPPIYMDNPLYGLVSRVVSILEMWNDAWRWTHPYSDVRVICWMM